MLEVGPLVLSSGAEITAVRDWIKRILECERKDCKTVASDLAYSYSLPRTKTHFTSYTCFGSDHLWWEVTYCVTYRSLKPDHRGTKNQEWGHIATKCVPMILSVFEQAFIKTLSVRCLWPLCTFWSMMPWCQNRYNTADFVLPQLVYVKVYLWSQILGQRLSLPFAVYQNCCLCPWECNNSTSAISYFHQLATAKPLGKIQGYRHNTNAKKYLISSLLHYLMTIETIVLHWI